MAQTIQFLIITYEIAGRITNPVFDKDSQFRMKLNKNYLFTIVQKTAYIKHWLLKTLVKSSNQVTLKK